MYKEILQEIAETLNSDGWNYTVFLEAYEVDLQGQTDGESIIKLALGSEASLYEIHEVDGDEVWRGVKEALHYAGDKSAGPGAATLASEKLAKLLEALRAQLADLAATSTSIESFWMKDGHPGYRVYWDFAFLFRRMTSATIIIGSSSD